MLEVSSDWARIELRANHVGLGNRAPRVALARAIPWDHWGPVTNWNRFKKVQEEKKCRQLFEGVSP